MDDLSDDLSVSNEGFATQSRLLRDLNVTAGTFGKSLTKAFSSGITEGKRFEDILRSVGQRLSDTALKAAFKPLESGVSNLLSQGFASLSGMFGGSGQALGSVQAFADGGIVGQPTYFGMGRSLGLMGEAGAEAILPLARGSDGKLGVSSGGSGGQPVNVTVNISTPDIEGFRRSEGQMSATIARAVARGRRSL